MTRVETIAAILRKHGRVAALVAEGLGDTDRVTVLANKRTPDSRFWTDGDPVPHSPELRMLVVDRALLRGGLAELPSGVVPADVLEALTKSAPAGYHMILVAADGGLLLAACAHDVGDDERAELMRLIPGGGVS